MGCQVSSDGGTFEKSEFDHLWKRMNSISGPSQPIHKNQKGSENGWRMLRILLVSTFKDFRNERSKVADMIKTKLQAFANEKRVFIQLEDLNFGSKASLEESGSLYSIERCIRECRSTSTYFYVHFLGECAGYIIDQTFTDDQFLRQHQLSNDQSLSEVFLQLGGLNNPNSIFLHRNSSFLQELPFNITNFIDSPKNRERANYMADTIKSNVSSSKYIEYTVRTSGINNTHFKQIQFDDLSSAIDPIEKLITRYIDNLEYPDSINTTPVDKMIMNYYSNQERSPYQQVVQKVQQNIKARKSTVIYGDYCSGKSTVLHLLKKPNIVLLNCFEGMTSLDIRRVIDVQMKVEMSDIGEKASHLMLVDDVHLMTKESQNVLACYQQFTIIATSRRKKTALTEFEMIGLPSMESDRVTEELSKWLNGGLPSSSTSLKSSNILKISQQKRRRSVGNIEDGHPIDENIGWNSLKCRVIGTLGRIGSSEEKLAQLAQLSTLSVVEADICLMESDGRGHLLIAVLCYLTLVDTGLNEVELRSLLTSEYNLLPIGIRRNFRNLPFEYCTDEFYGQIPPLRWWITIHRLGHLLMVVDQNINHYVLSNAARKVVIKKFLKTPANLEHFKKRIRHFADNLEDNQRKNEVYKAIKN